MAGLSWQRSVPKLAIAAWMFGGLLASLVALLLAIMVRDGAPIWAQLTALSHLERRAASIDRDGAAVLRGALVGPSWRTSPLGRPSAMWSARVYQVTARGRSRSSKLLCSTAELASVALASDGVRVPIAWLDESPTVAVVEQDVVSVRDLVLTGQLDLGRSESTEVPPSILARCKLTAAGNLFYSEVNVAPEAKAEVTGCKRDGRIVACNEAPRLLSVNGVRSIAQRWSNRHDDVATLALFIGWFFAAVGAVALFAQARTHAPAPQGPPQ
jgi:hypothetical protein